MPNQVMLEQVKEQVNQLSWHDRIRLITYISEQLSDMVIPEINVSERDLQKQREKEADEILALCDAVAEKWSGPFDVVEDIRKLREERDESIWPEQVIDASIAIKWIVKDEPFRNEARRLLHDARAKGIELCAPPIFRYEVESVIQNSLLRKRLDLETANASLAVFYAINIQIISPPDLVVCARNIARRFQQNKIYDSLYAALAQLIDCEFWTADKAFFNAVSPELSFVKYLPDYS